MVATRASGVRGGPRGLAYGTRARWLRPTAAPTSHDFARSHAGPATGPRGPVIYPYSSVALAHLLAEDCLLPRAGFTLAGSSASRCERRLIKFANREFAAETRGAYHWYCTASSDRLHVTIPGSCLCHLVRSAAPHQSIYRRATRSEPIVSGCVREGYARFRFGYPTPAQRHLSLKPIVSRRWWRKARMRDGTKILSMRSNCNRGTIEAWRTMDSRRGQGLRRQAAACSHSTG